MLSFPPDPKPIPISMQSLLKLWKGCTTLPSVTIRYTAAVGIAIPARSNLGPSCFAASLHCAFCGRQGETWPALFGRYR